MTPRIQKFKVENIVYAVLFGVFCFLVLFMLVRSISFFRQTTNDIFKENADTMETRLVRLNVNDLSIVARKFGLTLGQSEPQPVIVSTTIAVVSSTPAVTSTQVVEVTPTSSVKISDLRIAIYNSTGKSGLALALKQLFEKAGFTVAEVGNVSPALATTTVKIKEERKSFVDAVKAVVAQKYKMTEAALEPAENFDAVITIGNE